VGTLLHGCVEVREPNELSFGVVSGLGGGMGVLDGVHVTRAKEGSREFVPPLPWGRDRHFQAKRANYSNVHIMETTAWIPTKFCVAVKTTKYAS